MKPKKERPNARYQKLAPTPIKVWSELLTLARQSSEVTLFAEDDAGSGLIQTKAQLTMLNRMPFALFDCQFYPLEPSAMIGSHMIEWTEGVPLPALYTINFSGDDIDERDTVIVTGKNFIYDIEVPTEEIGSLNKGLLGSLIYSREFYHLAPRLPN